MHVYLMLHELIPRPRKTFATRSQRSFGDVSGFTPTPRLHWWPYLRSAEYGSLVCAIPRPMERLALPADGQEIWSEAVRRFVETMALAGDRNVRKGGW